MQSAASISWAWWGWEGTGSSWRLWRKTGRVGEYGNPDVIKYTYAGASFPGPQPCPGFDLPLQTGGAPAAGVPGNSWPGGRVTTGGRVTASGRMGHTPNKGTGPPPFMQGEHNPQTGPPFPLRGRDSLGPIFLEFLKPGSLGDRSPSLHPPFETGS